MSVNDHHHHAGPAKALTYALVITVTFALVEVAGGLISGSLALLGDAGHMFTDVLALGLSLGAALVAGRAATERHTFGFLRVEILVALLNGVALVVISLMIVYEAVGRLYEPRDVDAGVMLLVAVVGLGANILGIRLLHHGSRENLNVRGAFLNMLGDLLSSCGVIVAAPLIHFFGWQAADPIISIGIAAIIMLGAYRLVSQSVAILLEAVPSHLDIRDVEEAMRTVEGGEEVHDLHSGTLSSGVYSLSGHGVVMDQQVSSCSQVLRDVELMLEREYHIKHTTIQVEAQECPGGYCRLKREDLRPR